MDIYEILGVSGDSSIEEITKAVEEFDEQFNSKKFAIKSFMGLYEYVHKWYEIRSNEAIIITDKKKACDILGIKQATKEELVGLIGYITNPFINTKSDCIKLHDAWEKGDEDYVRAVLMDPDKNRFTENQINAICTYCINEPNNIRKLHHHKWFTLTESNCFIETNNKKEVAF